jgi:hypothetical protein
MQGRYKTVMIYRCDAGHAQAKDWQPGIKLPAEITCGATQVERQAGKCQLMCKQVGTRRVVNTRRLLDTA